MGKRIKIRTHNTEVIAELNNTRTAQAIWEALPIKGLVRLWGDEIYFSLPLILRPESAKEVVNIGDLGYWPEGNAFCIFFGLTPASKGDQIKPASAVNVFGKIIGNATVLKKVNAGAKITIEQDNGERQEPQNMSLLIQQQNARSRQLIQLPQDDNKSIQIINKT